MHARLSAAFLLVALSATGCNLFGGESTEAATARRESDGRAVGGACRHAGRAIEDCYTLNRRADKASVYAGWREMNDYMRENKLDPVAPQLTGETVAQAGEGGGEGKKAGRGEKGGDKSTEKASAKSDKGENADKSDKSEKTEKAEKKTKAESDKPRKHES
jgi:hypothetical protein